MIKTNLKILGSNHKDLVKKVIKIYHWIAVIFIATVIHIYNFLGMISFKMRKTQWMTICLLNTLNWMKDRLTILFFHKNLELTIKRNTKTSKLFLMINTLLLSNTLKIMNKKVLAFSKWTIWKSPFIMKWKKKKSTIQALKKLYFWTITYMKKWKSKEFYLLRLAKISTCIWFMIRRIRNVKNLSFLKVMRFRNSSYLKFMFRI